jgi:hypothetical protein
MNTQITLVSKDLKSEYGTKAGSTLYFKLLNIGVTWPRPLT